MRLGCARPCPSHASCSVACVLLCTLPSP
jgi:hypothetical protein